jgi:hypothetical protein
MRRKALGVCAVGVLIGLGAVTFAQQQQQQRKPAPTTEAAFWTLDEQNGHMRI